MLHTSAEPNNSAPEQLLGARLAAEYTREIWPSSAPGLELLDRPIPSDPSSVGEAAQDLVHRSGCVALMGMVTVPVSIRAGQWAEANRVLYMAANNDPRVRAGRRHAFGIGVPSEITGQAAARYLHEDRGASRVFILHRPGEFQAYATQCTVEALSQRGIAVATEEIGEDEAADGELLERVRAWRPDAICLQAGAELERLAQLLRRARGGGGLPRMLLSRSMLCREFARLCGPAAEGQDFTDLYLRDDRAPEEERALTERLAVRNAGLVATANHGFGWDGLRLVVEALRAAGSDPDAQVAFLESLQRHPAATGLFTFDANDHNGRWHDDPTTIARLSGGQFILVSSLAR